MYYLSVDGGGSKTAILITDEFGNVIVRGITDGCAYPQIGIRGVQKVILTKLEQLLMEKGLKRSDVKAAAFGIPCFGEDRVADEQLKKVIWEIIPYQNCYICNDVELGWAGSLGMEAGVHVVAGTGAIVFGKDTYEGSTRANGWHEDYSDEGSGYWLGMKLLALFAKQADGRIEKSVLYRLVQDTLGIKDAEELVSVYTTKYKGDRKKVASLQMLLYKGAQEGDINAVALYKCAGWELAKSIKSVANKLNFSGDDPIPVSYSGGVFQVGPYVLDPLRQCLDLEKYEMREPMMDPVHGGILLAVNLKVPEDIVSVRSVLKNGMASGICLQK